MIRNINLIVVWVCLLACTGQERDNQDNRAAGTGDPYVARRVSGMWLLSTDYHYEDICNFIPEEFVRQQFHLDDKLELAKYSDLNRCEFRWNSNAIGFYMETEKPFESTFKSEYFFDKHFQNQSANDSSLAPSPTHQQPLSGPDPEGTAAQFAKDTTDPSSKLDSTRGFDPSAPITGMTKPKPPLATPAHNTPTGIAVQGVGDKAVWESKTKTLHVLYINHVFSVRAQMPSNPDQLKQGCILLAKLVMDSLYDNTD